MNVFVQLQRRQGRIDRVRGSDPPVIEMILSPGQYIVSVELEPIFAYRARKTTDWRWTAYVATPLPRES